MNYWDKCKDKTTYQFDLPHIATCESFTHINHAHNGDQYLCSLAAITHKCQETERQTWERDRALALEGLNDNDIKNHSNPILLLAEFTQLSADESWIAQL